MFVAGSELRVAFFWAVFTLILVGLSAQFATQKPGDIRPLPALVLAFAAMGNRLAAVIAPFALLRPYVFQWPRGIFVIALLAAVAASMWANFVSVQFLQNLGYRLVGAKQQPIRCYPPFRRTRRRRRA